MSFLVRANREFHFLEARDPLPAKSHASARGPKAGAKRTSTSHADLRCGLAAGFFAAGLESGLGAAIRRSGNPASGDVGDAKLIRKFGDVPDDQSAL